MVPAVWVVASHRMLKNPGGHDQRYTVMDEAGQLTVMNMGLQPMCYPRAPLDRLEALLGTVDGILLGGSDTNVHPHLYGEEPHHEGMLFDRERDELAHALIRLAIGRRVPVIGFCRGSHDMNVAMGGSLHQCLKDDASRVKHWEDPGETLDEQYAPRHDVALVEGGELERITGLKRFAASSLHSQGAKDLGQGLVAEAHADDGLVEAFRWHDASQFAWGFQFHPEWGWRDYPPYGRIMAAYVDAVWQHHRARAQRSPTNRATSCAKPAPPSEGVTQAGL